MNSEATKKNNLRRTWWYVEIYLSTGNEVSRQFQKAQQRRDSDQSLGPPDES